MSLEGKSKEEVEALAALADSLLENQTTSGQFKRLLKSANPKLHIPEVEAEERTAAALRVRDERIGKLEGTLQQGEAEKQANVLFENLRDASLVNTRADFNTLVKWASENGFMTSETGLRKAAQQRALEQEAAEPTPPTLGGALLPKENKDLMKDPIAWGRQTAMQAMDELRTRRSRGRVTH